MEKINTDYKLEKYNITFSRCANRDVVALNTGVLLTQTELRLSQ